MVREARFTNTNWFSFQGDTTTDHSMSTFLVSPSPKVKDNQANNMITLARQW